MRQVDRRSVLIGASAALAGVLGGGCTNGSTGPTPAPTRANGAGRRRQGRIVVALQRRPTDQAWEALVQAYREQNPGIEVTWQQPEQGRDYGEWLRTVLASEDRPDIVTGVEASAPAGLTGSDGREPQDALVDLNRYRGRINPYTQHSWEEDLDFSISRPSGPEGVIETVGTERVRPLWFYNTAMFDEAGVEPPGNWDELLNVCEQLSGSSPDVVPFATSYSDVIRRWMAAAYFDQYHPNWVNLVRAREGDWNYRPRLDGEYNWRPEDPTLHAGYTFSPQRFLGALAEEQISYDTSAMAGLAGDLASLLRSYANPDLFEEPDHRAMFLDQRAAMMVEDSSMSSVLRLDLPGSDRENFDWATFDFPAMSGAGAPSVVRPGERPGGFRASVVSKEDTEQVRLATDFLMFWFSSAGYEPFVSADGGQYHAEGPPLLADVDFPRPVRSMLEDVETPGAVGPPYGDFWLTGGGEPTVANDLERLFRRLVDDELGPVQYAQRLQRYVRRNLDTVLSGYRLTRSDLEAPQRPPVGA